MRAIRLQSSVEARKEIVVPLITCVADKAGFLGSRASATGCASCFPAIASFGAAIGLGFLSQYEGLFICILLPAFAGITLLANALGWFSHRQWQRTVLGAIGPVLVLAAVYLTYGWRGEALLYVGLAFMVGVSIWDLRSPAQRVCAIECSPRAGHRPRGRVAKRERALEKNGAE